MEYRAGEKDELVPQLFIGDHLALKDKAGLKESKITHVLTLAKELGEVKDFHATVGDFKHKHYDFEDNEDQLLLPHFNEINEFISEGLEEGGVLLVSYSGVSRSAVIALEFLMGMMKLSYEEAVKMVTGRRFISFNHNFAVQLKLYQKMKLKFDKKNKHYNAFLSALKDEQTAKRELWKKAEPYTPQDSQLASRLTALTKKQAETELRKKSFAKGPKDTDHLGHSYGCGYCKHKLFLPQNVVVDNSADVKDWSESVYVYIEPLEWIKGELNDLQGGIHCPSCNLLLGQWDWEGTLLSSDVKVIPSFRIHKALLCSFAPKKGGKGKEKTTYGYKGWPGFVEKYPLGYTSPLLPSTPVISPRRSTSSDEAVSGDTASSNNAVNEEKHQEKKKDSNSNSGNSSREKLSDPKGDKPQRKPPVPPKKPAKDENNHSEGSKIDGKHEEEKKGGFMGFMGRFKKKNSGKASPPAEKAAPAAGTGPKQPKGENPKKASSEDFGEDNIQPVAKGQAQQPIEVTGPDDLPKELIKVIKGSKISEEEVNENFIILLNCLHFLTKRHFVWKPKRPEDEEGGEKGEEEVIKIGGVKRKKKKKALSNLPPASELISDGDIKKAFKVQEVVGEGGFGRVHSARNLKGKGRVAIKKMTHMGEREKLRNFKEVNFLRMIDHPCIVKYFCSYEVKDELWVVMEFMEGGTLTEALKGFNFEEKHIAFAAKEMLKGIKYLHGRNLVHRDLKSGNIMMTTQGDVKLIDFGLCVDLNEEKDPEHMVGSPFWMPPEMIKRQVYGPAVDIWSFAICLLELANGQPPNRRSALKAMFVAGTVGYPQPFNKPEHWSSNFKDFIGKCLEMDPSRRATAEELLQHPFLEKADTKKGMKKILSHIFLQNTIDMMNLGGI